MKTTVLRHLSCYDGNNEAELAWRVPSRIELQTIVLCAWASFTLNNAISTLFACIAKESGRAGFADASASQDDDSVLAEVVATYKLSGAGDTRTNPVVQQKFDFHGYVLETQGTLYLNAYCGDGDAIVRAEAFVIYQTV